MKCRVCKYVGCETDICPKCKDKLSRFSHQITKAVIAGIPAVMVPSFKTWRRNERLRAIKQINCLHESTTLVSEKNGWFTEICTDCNLKIEG